MNEIQNLAESKTVILISHRLVNVVKADAIYVMVNGKIAESGKHRELLENKADYEKLWEAQQRLENYGKDGAVQCKKRSRVYRCDKTDRSCKTSYGLYGACCHNGDCRTFVRFFYHDFRRVCRTRSCRC